MSPASDEGQSLEEQIEAAQAELVELCRYRDQQIVNGYHHGVRSRHLARDWDLSEAEVTQIVSAAMLG